LFGFLPGQITVIAADTAVHGYLKQLKPDEKNITIYCGCGVVPYHFLREKALLRL